MVDQGSAAAAVGSDCGGGTGSGLRRRRWPWHEWAQASAGLRALITGQARHTDEVESRAREQREQGTGLKWLTVRGSGADVRHERGSR